MDEGLTVPGQPSLGAPGLSAPGGPAIGRGALETQALAVTYGSTPVAYQTAPVTYL